MRKQMAIPAAVPAVAFGGSYGGEVVSWLRASQPDDFSAAIASR
jgi:dipeptidyl aminopeptidase/acylaminoacyl peptidase